MRSMQRRALTAMCMCLAVVLVGCAPSETTSVRELNPAGSSSRAGEPPTFPDTGNVPEDLVIDGVAHDLTARPDDRDYWVPRVHEGECAAEQIVASVGADRIVALGYRPGTPGASLNDLDLTDEERRMIIDAFTGCVDMAEGFAAVLYGSSRMPGRVATCVARGMARSGEVEPLVEAWVAGRAVDPFERDSAFASALLGHAEVCIPNDAFNWPDVRLPEGETVFDSDLPAGSKRSLYADDAKRRTDAAPAPDGELEAPSEP